MEKPRRNVNTAQATNGNSWRIRISHLSADYYRLRGDPRHQTKLQACITEGSIRFELILHKVGMWDFVNLLVAWLSIVYLSEFDTSDF